MKYKKILGCVMIACSLALGGCAKNVAPGDYDASEVGKVKKVVPGVIISKRPVNIHNKGMESGANPVDNVDNTVTRSRGYEYVIKLDSGAVISLVQTENLNLKTKQRILVIYGDNTRVVPDDGSEEN